MRVENSPTPDRVQVWSLPALRTKLNRRQLLATLPPMAVWVSCRSPVGVRQNGADGQTRFFFVSQGKTGLINADGTGLRYLEFNVPNQATWQPVDFFSEGHRVL